MNDIIGRDFCLQQPTRVIRLFGIVSFLKMFFSPGKTLLESVLELHRRRGVEVPGPLGRAYKISALIEFRVARIYGKLAEKFSANRNVKEFFLELKDEEEEHGRLMLLCLFTTNYTSGTSYIPGIRDPEIQELLKKLRHFEKNLKPLSLDEALRLTVDLEKGETNIIFDKLLKQSVQEETCIFMEEMEKAGSHITSVPRRIKELRERIRGSW